MGEYIFSDWVCGLSLHWMICFWHKGNLTFYLWRYDFEMQSKYLQVRFTCCIEQIKECSPGILIWKRPGSKQAESWLNLWHWILCMSSRFSSGSLKTSAVPTQNAPLYQRPRHVPQPPPQCLQQNVTAAYTILAISRLCMIACVCMCVCVGVEPSLVPTFRCD